MKISPISSSHLEISYFSVLVAIAFSYMIAGLGTIQTTELSNAVPPLVMSLFNHCLSMLTCYSTARAFLVPSQLEESAANRCLVNSAVEFFHLVFDIFFYSSAPICYFFPKSTYIYLIATTLYFTYPSFFPSHYINLLSRVLNSPSLHPFATWLQIYMSDHKKTDNFLPLVISAAAAPEQEKKNSIFSRNKKIVKMIKFAVGMMGTILFQYYFRLNSFKEVLAFLYIAVAWLANITLLSVTGDFGVFNFILGNVMVGSTVGRFGLRIHTWLAYAASLLLYRLRLELESVAFIHGGVLDARGVLVYVVSLILVLFSLPILGYLTLSKIMIKI